MKFLGVNPSEYEWLVLPNPKAPKSLIVIHTRDGEKIVHATCPFDVEHASELDDEEKRFVLNVFLQGYLRGQRVGALDKINQIKDALEL